MNYGMMVAAVLAEFKKSERVTSPLNLWRPMLTALKSMLPTFNIDYQIISDDFQQRQHFQVALPRHTPMKNHR